MSSFPDRSSSIFKKYGYFWATLVLLLLSIAGHWLFGWHAYVDEAEAHGQPVEVSAYSMEMLRDTFENWQSEFLQLIWQVAGLAFLFYIGSSQSREGDERLEAKIDWLMEQSEGGARRKEEFDERFVRH